MATCSTDVRERRHAVAHCPINCRLWSRSAALRPSPMLEHRSTRSTHMVAFSLCIETVTDRVFSWLVSGEHLILEDTALERMSPVTVCCEGEREACGSVVVHVRSGLVLLQYVCVCIHQVEASMQGVRKRLIGFSEATQIHDVCKQQAS